jgi:antitoxin component YwqK of YwqJK toxin-antitoxin module
MRHLIVLGVCFFGFAVQAQTEQHQVEDQMVKSTFYYEDGAIKQSGFYKDGKVHGQWVSYDENGRKLALGQFNEGKKVGKWFFWSDENLTEVDYSEARITQVKQWTNSALVFTY